MTPPVSAHRFDHIDAIRAIAALLVVWDHVTEELVSVTTGGQWLFFLGYGANVGSIGVTLFFLVSGFVIPASLRADRPRGDELRVFAIRRFFRLYPVYWLSLLLGLVAVWWIWGKPIDLETIAANATMLAGPLGYGPILSLYWTLSTELAFYLLCAILFAFGLLGRPLVLALCAAGFALAVLSGYLPGALDNPALHVLYDTGFALHLSLMFAGALLRQWYDGELRPGLPRALLLAVLTLWVVLPVWSGTSVEGGERSWAYPWFEGSKALGLVLFLVLCFRLKPEVRQLAALGRASYSLYLIHMPVGFGLLWLATIVPAFAWLRAELTLDLLLALAISIGLAALGYRFIELPAIALGRRLSRSGTVPAGAAAPRVHA